MRVLGERSRWLCAVVSAASLAWTAGCGEDAPAAAAGASGRGCTGAACLAPDSGTAGASGLGGAADDAASGGVGGMQDASVPATLVGPASTACAPIGPLASALGATRSILYSGPEELSGLAVRGGALFAIDGTGIVRLAEGGSALERVATAQVDEIHAADLRLYWIENAQVFRASFDGSAQVPELVAMNAQEPATWLQNDETDLYYAHVTSQSVWRQPIDGSAATQLVSAVRVQGMELHGGSLFYANGGDGIRSVAVEGGDAEDFVIDAPRPVLALDMDGTSLVWTDSTEILGVTDDAPDEIVALSQGGPSLTGASRSRITSFVRLGEDVYFADAAGSVGHASMEDAAACSLLAQHAGEIRALAIDGGAAGEGAALYVNVRLTGSTELWRLTL